MYSVIAQRIVLTGLGKRGELDLEKWRGAASKAGQFIRNSGIKQIVFPIERFDGHSAEELTEGFVIGLLLGIYQFNEFKTIERDKIKEIGELILLGERDGDIQGIQEGLKTGQIISEAVYLARDLVNGHGNQVTPSVLAEKAQQIARDHALEMEVDVLEVNQTEVMGMGAFVAVAKGSQEPGKFIVLEYNKGERAGDDRFSGKGNYFR